MANGLIERAYVQDVADAIREKNGSSDTYTPAQMGDAIRALETGGGFYPSLLVESEAAVTAELGNTTVSLTEIATNTYWCELPDYGEWTVKGDATKIVAIDRVEMYRPRMTTPLGDFETGSTVKMNLNGTAWDFLVVQQGNPDATLYDESCDGTWVLLKDIYENDVWHSTSGSNDYANSTINAYLNSDFLAMFDSGIQSQIKQVKIPYRPDSGYATTVNSGANGLLVRIFLLAGCEAGLTSTSSSLVLAGDGACLDYFVDTAAAEDNKRIAYRDGTAGPWYFRSPSISKSANYVAVCAETGKFAHSGCTAKKGVRPCIILPKTTKVNDAGFIIP